MILAWGLSCLYCAVAINCILRWLCHETKLPKTLSLLTRRCIFYAYLQASARRLHFPVEAGAGGGNCARGEDKACFSSCHFFTEGHQPGRGYRYQARWRKPVCVSEPQWKDADDVSNSLAHAEFPPMLFSFLTVAMLNPQSNTSLSSFLYAMSPPYSIIVHGGAWAIPEACTKANLAGAELAAQRGHAVLSAGGSALDACEAAVRHLEDDATFAAGLGSCLTASGTVETDAAIMTASPGTPARAGAVACASRARNPITLARAVMERTEHVLLVGAGADSFADSAGVDVVAPDALITPAALAEWREYRRYGDVVGHLFRGGGHDTVGAAAVDRDGNVAAATSTGGITFKRDGRVGDSPIVGAGLFADTGVGACSTTGHGESILKTTLARYALWLVEREGCEPQRAAEEAVRYMKKKTDGGCGGLIIVDQKGDLGFAFSTTRMVWASVDKHGKLASGIDPAS